MLIHNDHQKLHHRHYSDLHLSKKYLQEAGLEKSREKLKFWDSFFNLIFLYSLLIISKNMNDFRSLNRVNEIELSRIRFSRTWTKIGKKSTLVIACFLIQIVIVLLELCVFAFGYFEEKNQIKQKQNSRYLKTTITWAQNVKKG